MTPSRTATPTPTRPVKPPLRRTPLTLFGFLAAGAAATIVVVLLVVAIYISKSAYQAAHQTTPTAAVDSFLQATLQERDLSMAQDYMCSDSALTARVSKVINQIKSFDRGDANASVVYNWERPTTISRHQKQATVAARVRVRRFVDGAITNSRVSSWRFKTINESGWKVCGLTIPEN